VNEQQATGDVGEQGIAGAQSRDPLFLTRRAVLAAGLGTLVSAAAAGLEPSLAVAKRLRAPTLWPAGADVWALSIDVEGTPAAAQVSVDGQPLATTPGSDGFTASVPLGPGANTVLAAGPGTAPGRSRTYVARVEDRPTARVSVSVEAGAVRLDSSGTEPDPYSAAPIGSVSWRRRDGTPLGSGSVLTLQGPWADGEQYVVASVTDMNGHTDESTVVFVVCGGVPEAVETQTWQPQWVQSAVLYGAIPPLFGQPPLEALTAQLDRLGGLGVNVIWLSPIFATTPGEFGYAVTDYFTVRSDYGDLASLQALVKSAHARDIKVILDLPLNDTSSQHPYYVQAQEDTTGSHYWEFYERNAKGHAVHYFNWKDLPNLNYENVEVRRLATEVAVYWLREAGVDGFRCDAAWGVQERNPEFWAQWRAELQRIRPDLLLLAEASAREDVWATAGFSAAYDWTSEPGQWAWESAFSRTKPAAPGLRSALGVPTGSRPLRFLENNDTGKRFITRYGLGTTKAAAAMLLSLPGIPCIYTGQEIGAAYEPYERTEPLDWTNDPNELEPYYRSLIEQRLANPSLATGSLTLLEASPSADVLAFLITTAQASLLVAVNFSATELDALIDTGEGAETALALPAWSAVTRQPA
jgi:cyclomaltodextrinase / maltogenic alpha-amylase / neopullulanase